MKRKIVQTGKLDILLKNADFEKYDSKTPNGKKKKRRKPNSNEIELKNEKEIEIKHANSEIGKSNDNSNTLEKSDDSDHEDTQKAEITKEESDRFNGKFLRNAFNSADGFAVLQKFVLLFDQNRKKDLVVEYLEAGGSVLEILRLLDSSEKRNINNITTVFTAMHIIIMKILEKYAHHQSSAEEACRHLINSHLVSIHSMLSSQSKSKHRKVVLKLLAAIVSLGGTLPRELLNHLSLHPQLIAVLTLHSKPSDPQNVRTCFIHFILAFLIEGNASNIRVLLEKRAIFSGIFSGLIYDHANVVQLVLATMKKYVLENPIVTKTMKLHLFSTPAMKDIIALYHWKGPKNWQKHKKQNTLQEYIPAEQKEIIVNIVHEFLITLLTSTRHGVAFHDRSLGTEYGSKHNQLINTVLQNLDKPWEHDKISDLVTQILSACPDLIKPQLIYTEPFLVPRISKNWIDVMQFIKKIISNIDIKSCLNLGSTDMSLQQLTNAMLNLILPPILIKNVILPSMEHSNILIHYETIDVLSTILRKVESLLEAFKESKHNRSEYTHFKNIIFEYISKHMPTFESILNIWSSAFSVISDTEIVNDDLLNLQVNIGHHLMTILNVLQAYSKNFPEILFVENLTNVKNKPVTLLTSLDNIENINKEDLVAMKVKALKILMTLNISDFTPNKVLFSTTLSFLLSQVGINSLLDSEILKTTYLLLNKCDVLEEYNDEIEIWINAITYFKSINHKLEIANWITKIIMRVSKHTEKYTSMLYKYEVDTEEETIKTKRRENIFTDLSEKNIEDVKLVVPMLPASSISLLVYGAIENYQKNPSETISNYLSSVLTHILHCQISPKALISLTKEVIIPSQNYMISWKKHQSPSIISEKLFNSNNIFSTFSKLLLNCEAYSVNIVESKLCIQFDGSTSYYQLTDYEVKALFRMVIFYLMQLSQENCIDSNRIAIYTNILLILLNIASGSTSEDTIRGCTKHIFQHPILLQLFQPIFIDSNTIKFQITKLIIEVLKGFENLKKELVTTLYSYQLKLIKQVKSFAYKHKDSKVESDLKLHLELIGLMQLNKETVVDLMTNIMILNKEKFIVKDKRELSIWGIMVPELIKQFCLKTIMNKSKSIITLNHNLLNKLIVYSIALKSQCKKETSIWESSLFDYLLILPHSISVITGNIFTSILKSEVTLVTEKLLKLLVERNPKFVTILIKYANSNNNILHHKSLIFSIISQNLKYKYDEKFSLNVFEFYKTDIMKYLIEGDDKQSSWIQKHINAVSYLIQKYFDPKLCQDVINKILSDEKKLDTVCETQIMLLFSIFKNHSEIQPSSLKNFVQILLHITVIVLKKDSKNNSKLNFLCQKLIESIEILKIKKEFSFDELIKYNSWPQFTRIILKSGLKMTKDNKNENLLLRALVTSCDAAYRDNGNEEYVKTIFEMATSHSEFINIMLSNIEIKSDLIKLLWILVRKNHLLMATTHIPLYLASYNATLAKSDQLIFKLLQFYESNGVKLNEFRPYLWGNAAALHYSVKGETDAALWKQPSTSQVLDLLTSENVANTIKRFPTHRKLEMENDFSSTRAICNQVYDPAFYLSVLNQLLKDNNIVACHKVIHSGALSLTIMACTSSCQKIRLKAFDTVSKFAFHLEATRSKEKPLWSNFIDALHNGIKNMEVSIENVQLNGFVATFLARTCLIITQPLNPLYSPLHAFLMAKSALNLSTIPELLQLYHSSEIHHQIYRHWILEVIRDGLKTNNDVDVALKCVLFKMLFDFYFSSISDKTTKDLILQVVKSATALTKLCTILVNGYSLLPWLMNITKNLKKGDSISCSCIIEIVSNIISVFKETKSRDAHHNLILIKTLLSLKNHFNHDMTEESLKSFINLLNQLITNRAVCKALPVYDLKSLVDFSNFFIEDISEFDLMLQFGCKFANNDALDETVSLKNALRKLLITWFTYTK